MPSSSKHCLSKLASGLLTHRSTSRIQSHVHESLQAAPVACSTTLIFHVWKLFMCGKGGTLFLRDLVVSRSDESDSEEEDSLLEHSGDIRDTGWVSGATLSPRPSFGWSGCSTADGVVMLATKPTKPGGAEGNDTTRVCDPRQGAGHLPKGWSQDLWREGGAGGSGPTPRYHHMLWRVPGTPSHRSAVGLLSRPRWTLGHTASAANSTRAYTQLGLTTLESAIPNRRHRPTHADRGVVASR